MKGVEVSDRQPEERMGMPTTRAEIRQLLRNLLLEIAKIPAEKIQDCATLDGDLEMESVALVEIQTALEDMLDVELDVLHVIQLNQMGSIVDYIYRCTSPAVRSRR